MEYFSSRSSNPGEWVADAPAYDYPLIDAASEQEWHYFLGHLRQHGYLELAPKAVHPPNSYRLTVQGWNKLEESDQEESRTRSHAEPLRVFLCHASDDKATVKGLYLRLREDNFDPWLDNEDLLPGQNWRQKIPSVVRNSDAVIVCLSQRSINKEGYVQREIKIALDAADEKPEGTIFLIPVRLEECAVPERLSTWHWVNLFETGGYAKLKKTLRSRAGTLERASAGPRERLQGQAIDLFCKSSSFKAARESAQALTQFTEFSGEDMNRILIAATTNDQIYQPRELRKPLHQLFSQHGHLADASLRDRFLEYFP